MPVRDFEDLIVWRKSVDFAVEIYRLTGQLPREERFELRSQLRRAAISVSSNIAEGNGRGTTRDYVNFLAHSRGSLYEVRSLLVVCDRLGFISKLESQPAVELTGEVGRMLSALRSSLQKRMAAPSP